MSALIEYKRFAETLFLLLCLSLLGAGQAFAQSTEDQVRSMAFEKIGETGTQLVEALGFALEASDDEHLQEDIQSEDGSNLPGCGSIFDGYQTRTISLSGGGTLLVLGADYEGGVAFRCGSGNVFGRDHAKFFGSGGFALRLGVAADAALNIGHWKVPYNNMRGRSVGFEIEFGDPVNNVQIASELRDALYEKLDTKKKVPVSIGITYWWENTGNGMFPQPGAYQGFVISLVRDAGFEFGAGMVTAKSVQFCDNDTECTLGLWRDASGNNTVLVRKHIFDPDESKPNLKLGDHYFVADIDSSYLDLDVKEKIVRGQPLDWSDYRERRDGRTLYRACFRSNYTKLVLSRGGGICNNSDSVTLTHQRALDPEQDVLARDYRGYWHATQNGRTRYVRIVERDGLRVVIEEFGSDEQLQFLKMGVTSTYIGQTGQLALHSGELRLIENGRSIVFERNTAFDDRNMLGADFSSVVRVDGEFWNAEIGSQTVYEEVVSRSRVELKLRRRGETEERRFMRMGGFGPRRYVGQEGMVVFENDRMTVAGVAFRRNALEDDLDMIGPSGSSTVEVLPISGTAPETKSLAAPQEIDVIGAWTWTVNGETKTNLIVAHNDKRLLLQDRRNPLKRHTYKKIAPNTYKRSSGSRFEFRSDTILVWTSRDGADRVVMRRK